MNNLSAFNPTYWSKRMQVIHYKKDVYRATANFEERATLTDGEAVKRPYRSVMTPQAYNRGVPVNIKSITSTNETLNVDTAEIVPFYVDDLDRIQNKWDAANAFSDDAGKYLSNEIDARYNAQVLNAFSIVDDGTIGGTAGDGITLSLTNVLKVFTAAARQLDAQNIDRDGRFANISPFTLQIITEHLAGKNTALGDATELNGHQGRFMGFDLFLSNQLLGTARQEYGTNPTAADFTTINGVTFTFVAALTSTPGDVLIGATTADTLDNLVAAINGAAGDGVTYNEVTEANRDILHNIVAVDGTTFLYIKGIGKSYLIVSATMTAPADIWTLTQQIQHNMFGRKGAIDVVIQQMPTVKFVDVPDQLGKNVLPWTLFGMFTFREGTFMLVDVQIRSDAF